MASIFWNAHRHSQDKAQLHLKKEIANKQPNVELHFALLPYLTYSPDLASSDLLVRRPQKKLLVNLWTFSRCVINRNKINSDVIYQV